MDKADLKQKAEWKNKEIKNKMYMDEYHKTTANKANFETIAKNSVQPLEYKMNQAALDNLGISPKHKNLIIIPKFG